MEGSSTFSDIGLLIWSAGQSYLWNDGRVQHQLQISDIGASPAEKEPSDSAILVNS